MNLYSRIICFHPLAPPPLQCRFYKTPLRKNVLVQPYAPSFPLPLITLHSSIHFIHSIHPSSILPKQVSCESQIQALFLVSSMLHQYHCQKRVVTLWWASLLKTGKPPLSVMREPRLLASPNRNMKILEPRSELRLVEPRLDGLAQHCF